MCSGFADVVSVPLRGKYCRESVRTLGRIGDRTSVSVPLRGKYCREFYEAFEGQDVSSYVSVPLRGKYCREYDSWVGLKGYKIVYGFRPLAG